MPKTLTLLYVEDDVSTAHSFLNAFSDTFKKIIVAQNGEEGLALFQEQMPDLLISDLQLPKMSGLDMIERIRKIKPSFPIIVNSAFSDTHLLLQSIALHVDNYILKPIDPYKLLHVIEKVAHVIALEKKLNTTREIMQNMIDGVPDPVVYIEPDYTISMMNKAAKEQRDDSMEVNKCFHLSQKKSPACSEDSTDCPMNSVKKTKEPITLRHLRKDKEGNKRHVEVYMRPVLDQAGEIIAYLEIRHDITPYLSVQNHLVAEAEKLSQISMHDPLTHLPNRRLFMDRIAQTLKRKSRLKEQFGVFFIDLNHFKEVNDTFGHSAGDTLLIEVSKRMQKVIRKGDTLSRFGGDEFVLIIENGETPMDFSKVAKKIEKLFLEPFNINEEKIQSSCSIGISVYPQDGKSVEELLNNADKAMYVSKKAAGHQFQFFSKAQESLN